MLLAPSAVAVHGQQPISPDVRFGRASGEIGGVDGARNRNGASTPPVYKKKKKLTMPHVVVSAFFKTPAPRPRFVPWGTLFTPESGEHQYQ